MIDFLVNLACTNLEVAISLTFVQEYSFGDSGSAKHWDRCFRHHHHFHCLDSSCHLPLYAWCCCLRCRPIPEFIPLILIHCCLSISANLIYGFPLRMAVQYWAAFPLREFAPLRQEPIVFWFASNRSQILLNCYQAWSTYQHWASLAWYHNLYFLGDALWTSPLPPKWISCTDEPQVQSSLYYETASL